jgi:hypothetical protein
MSTLVHAAVGTVPYPQDPQASQEVIKAYILGTAAPEAALRKQTHDYNIYVTGDFGTWYTSYSAWRAEEPPPPVPPGTDALVNDDVSDFDLVPAATPCGPMPAYTKHVSTGGGGIKTVTGGLLIGPVGAHVEQKDGTVWERIS